jgi:hypothetical protein
LSLVVVAAEVVAEPVELRVHARAVQALGVVLDDRLPVRGDVVVDPGAPPQLRVAVGVQVLGERADVFGQRRGRARDVAEQQAAEPLGAHWAQAVAAGVELLELLSVRGVAQAAVEAVGPRVVRTLEAADGALARGDEPGAAVAADVVEAAALEEQQALAGDPGGEEAAAAGDRARVADAHPAAEEQVLGLPRGDVLVDVCAGGEERRLQQWAERWLELLAGEHRPRRRSGAPVEPLAHRDVTRGVLA